MTNRQSYFSFRLVYIVNRFIVILNYDLLLSFLAFLFL